VGTVRLSYYVLIRSKQSFKKQVNSRDSLQRVTYTICTNLRSKVAVKALLFSIITENIKLYYIPILSYVMLHYILEFRLSEKASLELNVLNFIIKLIY